MLLASLFFYTWGEPKYIILMLASILLGYGFGRLIQAFEKTMWAKVFLSLSIVSGLGLLGVFKYADFSIQTFNRLTGSQFPLLKIALPIGISFYTFQILSYTMDVYRGTVKAQKSPLKLATYVALFPQLIAGPIVRYADVAAQLDARESTPERLYTGLRRLILGLAKKVLLANTLGELCAVFRASGEKSVLFYWIYAVAFSLQIYFDFSGYSDMAIGMGRMFGFDFLENFNYPYISKSITEFWRRWHISLSSWFRDYLYIPLGGNRVSLPRWLLNIALVWALTGLWHGAAWNFALWGMCFAVLLIAEKLGLGALLKKLPPLVSHGYVLFFVVLSFVLFNASGLGGARQDLSAIFGLSGLPFSAEQTLYYLRSYALVLLAAMVGSTPLCRDALSRIRSSGRGERLIRMAEPPVLIVLLLTASAYLVDGSFNPFLYFRF